MNHHLISLMLLFPLLGAALQTLLPPAKSASSERTLRWIAFAASVVGGLLAFVLVLSMSTPVSEVQWAEVLPWVGSYAITYDMGVDGLNALLVLLIAVIFPVLIGSEWSQRTGARGMHGLLLLLQASFFGAVCAQDIFLQFFFWAFSALPFYFLIGIWGGEDRESAAFRAMVTSTLGNALVFGALVLVYYSVDPHSFSLRELAGGKLSGKSFELLGHSLSVPATAFALVGAGLALRAPIWPLHGWFTQVAEEAPPSVLVAMAAVNVPVATYIFIRLTYSLFPETLVAAAPVIVAIGAINLVAGGICAVAQKELRLLLAYVCLSQVGLILLGVGSLNSAGLVGAVYQQLVLGLCAAGFGLFTGLAFARTGNTNFLRDGSERGFGGVAVRAPSVAVVAGIIVASLLGFPGSGGFVGNALVVIGSYAAHPGAVFVAGAALLLAAFYLFTMYRCVFLGKAGTATAGFTDLTIRERAYFLPLVVALLIIGIYPKPLLDLVRPTVLSLLSTVK